MRSILLFLCLVLAVHSTQANHNPSLKLTTKFETNLNNCTAEVSAFEVGAGLGQIFLSGLTENDNVKIFNADFQITYECAPWFSFSCFNENSVTVPLGEYFVSVQSDICEEWIPVTFEPSCPDADGDGTCAFADCDDNDPSVPVSVTTPCDDNNPNTINDVYQPGSCICAGTPIPGCTVEVFGGSTVAGFAPVFISGITSNQDVKLKDANLNIVFECGPSFATSCTPQYEVLVDTDQQPYFLVVQSDDCYVSTTVIFESACIDMDGDGLCSFEDCDDNNPLLPATSATPCDDNDPSTINDVYQVGSCNCAGTFVSNSLTLNCPDDVTIQIPTGSTSIVADWPSAIATSTCPQGLIGSAQQVGGVQSGTVVEAGSYFLTYFAEDNCGLNSSCSITATVLPADGNGCNVTANVSNNNITITGLTSGENTKLFDENFGVLFECNPWSNNCSASETISNLPNGNYFVSVQSGLCDEFISLTIDGIGCVDMDNDGICAAEDCNDFEPSLPATPGTPCDDNDASTENDVYQADGCECMGTPIMECTVNVDAFFNGTFGGIEITGMAPSYSVQILNANLEVGFECNPDSQGPAGQGCPSTFTQLVSQGGDTYFVSVQSEFCDEFITVTVPNIPGCGLDGTITNCTVNNAGVYTYDLFVENPNNPNGTFEIGNLSPQGAFFLELAYGEVHTLTEIGFPGNFKHVEDTDLFGCRHQILFDCEPVESMLTIENCPQDISITTLAAASWAEPFCNSTCAGDAAMCLTNQVTGPQNGEFLAPGIYTVTYEANDGCNNTATCSFTITVVGDPVGCNVNVTSANGEVIITGLTGMENTKLFDVDFNVVFECNPWNGNPCTANEVVSGLTIGQKYFLSVQSDLCDEWIPIAVEGGSGCDLQGTITNCNQSSNGDFTYDLTVTNPAGGTYLIGLFNQGNNGPSTVELAYNETHTVTESTFAGSIKFIEDSNDSDCNLLIDFPCEPTATPITVQNCQQGVLQVLGGQSANWIEPTVTSNCTGTFITQTQGPNNGDVLAPGAYGVVYEAENFCGNTNICSFTIIVSDNTQCSMSAAITNCTSFPDVAMIQYDIFVSNFLPVNSNTFTMPIATSQGIVIEEFTYGTIHTITEFSFSNSITKIFTDAENPNCSTQASGNCLEETECNLSGTITNCIENNTGIFNYQINVTGPVGGTFIINLFDIGSGPFTVELAYNETHSLGESGFSGQLKFIEDANNPDCNLQIPLNCASTPNILTIENCPEDFEVIAGQSADWTVPDLNVVNCDGPAFLNQGEGPDNGAILPVGTYYVEYRAGNVCGKRDTCGFNITVVEDGACNVNVSSTDGVIEIAGLSSNANTKLFDADFNVLFECNPWFGNACTGFEAIPGLNVGETYFLSVQSDVCEEFIPITVEGDLNVPFNKNTELATGTFNIDAVFPNPANQSTFVSIYSAIDAEYNLEIYDLVGKLQQQTTVNLEEGKNSLEIDIHDFNAGIYNIFLSNSKGQVKSVRLVKIND